MGEEDAPTRIRVGSPGVVARLLEPAGEAGMSFRELAQKLEATANLPEVSATGPAGTVYVCHPFLVHAAQPHRGQNPRFMAQSPFLAKKSFELFRPDGQYSPVERAIRGGLAR